jgi:hypothetical protein
MSLPPFVRASINFENSFFQFIFLFFPLSCNSSSWGPLPINKPLSYLRVEQHLVSITCPSYLCGSKQAFLPYFTPGMRRKGSQLSEMHQWGWPKNKYLKEPRRFFTVFGGTQSYLHFKWSLPSFQLMKFRLVCETGPWKPSSRSMDSFSFVSNCMNFGTFHDYVNRHPCKDASLMFSTDIGWKSSHQQSNWAM